MSLKVGRRALPDHARPCRPKVHIQLQTFACVVYMALIRADYRDVEAHLRGEKMKL